MKWAKLGKLTRSTPEDHRNSYEYYDQKTLESEFGLIGSTPDQNGRVAKPSPNLWVRHKFKKVMEEAKQKEYEIFCGGFLHFYDIEVRNKATNHIIYFHWSKEIKGFYYVSIFIFPEPYSDKKTDKALSPETSQQQTSNAVASKSSGAAGETSMAAMGSQDDWQGEFAAIDPPPPPPPPPPTRE
jgi:hypothetical protein